MNKEHWYSYVATNWIYSDYCGLYIHLTGFWLDDAIEGPCVKSSFLLCGATAATPTSENDKNQLKIICYYHLHTWYAPGYRDYSPEVIDESQCTHIVYTDRVKYTDLGANRTLHDGKQLFYSRVEVFRKKGINVSISFLKFNGYEYVRTLGNNETGRAHFVMSLVDFMDRNNFNGFDLFWGCKFCSNDNSRYVNQDENFMDFIRQLSEAFKPRGWLLSTFVSVSEDVVHPGFDVLKLSEYVDWMTVNPINLSQNSSSHLTPLFFDPGDPHPEITANWSVNYLIEKGVPAQKLVLPTSTMGRTYQLTSAEENGLNAPTDNRFTAHFYEICKEVLNENWTVVHDSDKRIGSYAYHGNRWTAYNDVEDVQRRGEYIIQNNLGGGSIVNLNYDDFEEKCGCGKNPLLRALVQVLRLIADPKRKNCT